MRFGALWLAATFCALLLAPIAPAQQWGTRPNGKALTELAPPTAPAVVLFFVATDCPISNRTFPEMARLREEFTPRGVRFWFVYPNTTEHAADIVAHQISFDRKGEALQDTTGSLVRLARAIVTPEIAVLIPAQRAGTASTPDA